MEQEIEHPRGNKWLLIISLVGFVVWSTLYILTILNQFCIILKAQSNNY
jgi:hypothetical protein